MEKGNWKYSVFKGKCPRCNEGDLWVSSKTYGKGFSVMHEKCSSCGLKYDMEQGFWYGAMYVSYALGVAVVVTVVVALTVLSDLSIFEKSGIATLFLIALMPPIFRLSRNAWVNFFVHYDKSLKSKTKVSESDKNK